MKKSMKLTGILLTGFFGLATLAGLAVGCIGTATPVPTHSVRTPTAMIPPTLDLSFPPTTFVPTFASATYTDDYAGFGLNYPADWTLDQTGAGNKNQRGYSVQLTSWTHSQGDISTQTPAGGSRLDITVYQWDPKDDLDAFIDSRKAAWESTGITIFSEDNWTLASGLHVVRFLVQAPDGKAVFIITTAGNFYLVLSGTGDLDTLSAIGKTIRLISAN